MSYFYFDTGEYVTARAASAAGTIMVCIFSIHSVLFLKRINNKYWLNLFILILFYCNSRAFYFTNNLYNHALTEIHLVILDIILIGYFHFRRGCFNRTWHSLFPALCELRLLIVYISFSLNIDQIIICNCL